MDLKLENFMPYRLSRLAEAFSEEIRPVYKDAFGLNRPEWRVLAAMANISPCSAKDLCAHSAQHKTKVSRAVHALETRRWLRRETDPSDRRSEVLTMTDAGRQAYAKLVGPLLSREAALMAALDPSQKAQVEAALDLLEQAIGLRKQTR